MPHFERVLEIPGWRENVEKAGVVTRVLRLGFYFIRRVLTPEAGLAYPGLAGSPGFLSACRCLTEIATRHSPLAPCHFVLPLLVSTRPCNPGAAHTSSGCFQMFSNVAASSVLKRVSSTTCPDVVYPLDYFLLYLSSACSVAGTHAHEQGECTRWSLVEFKPWISRGWYISLEASNLKLDSECRLVSTTDSIAS
ncbi:hypothetical protein CC1G_08104 [Coprinopsis cinerea okayama7|uniref:Uncharacterized protein n=1 Tax=Coprinopsis cinerea (strain Okayama-7 / 130 / ATCC MYA-4618 / FGSC 9003) TaxID=240176 RepID=A8NVI0_COPC7|nr:hypothetical protein CC1G_08104 [Coprinopsis cinerea okayama7\|eukprot:XP_001836719.2 hypothetical protein CC1G_08104 [Coprinopsis cinerea okayama7\